MPYSTISPEPYIRIQGAEHVCQRQVAMERVPQSMSNDNLKEETVTFYIGQPATLNDEIKLPSLHSLSVLYREGTSKHLMDKCTK
jgi:hypothetical protein